MPTAILKAHYDGRHIVLDEPFELPANAPLLVSVLGPDSERAIWAATGATTLARAYGDTEPDYTASDLKRP
jgi:hypothetical protein